MNKKIYFNPTMKVVMMKTVRMLADSGGVSTGDKPGYGCLQIHNLKSKTTALAFNHFNSDKVPCDVGIGNSTGEHPDWTFARNAGGYSARRLSVWVKTK